MSAPHAELKKILALKDDEKARTSLFEFFKHWEATDQLEKEVELIEKRSEGRWLVAAQPQWIERACSGEDEPRMRLAWAVIFVTPYSYKIRGKKLDDQHIVNLCASSHLGNIWKFSTLVSTSFGPKAFTALSEAPTLRLRDLSLPHCKPGKSGLTALGKGSSTTSLEKLSVADSKADGKSVEALLKGGALSSLRELVLYRNPIGTQGVKAIAQAPSLNKLEKLDLSDCQLDDDAMTALCQASALASMGDLTLSNNPQITAGVLARLASAPFLPTLRHLRLSRLQADGALLRALAAAGPIRLETLELGPAPLNAEDLEPLLGGAFPALTSLSISGCSIGEDGAIRLASSSMLTRLKTLDVSDCSLGDKGILALASAPSLASLESLLASGNGCSLKSWYRLRDAPSLRGSVKQSIDEFSPYHS